MTSGLIFEWDEEKRQKNIIERGLDIAYLAPMVLADKNVSIIPDDRKEYGEKRYKAFGLADDLRLSICFTMRDEACRLITIHKANKRDWRKYYGKDS